MERDRQVKQTGKWVEGKQVKTGKRVQRWKVLPFSGVSDEAPKSFSLNQPGKEKRQLPKLANIFGDD